MSIGEHLFSLFNAARLSPSWELLVEGRARQIEMRFTLYALPSLSFFKLWTSSTADWISPLWEDEVNLNLKRLERCLARPSSLPTFVSLRPQDQWQNNAVPPSCSHVLPAGPFRCSHPWKLCFGGHGTLGGSRVSHFIKNCVCFSLDPPVETLGLFGWV